MATNGIDFVIGGKNLAGAAFDGVLKSLGAISGASESLGKTFSSASSGLSKAIATLSQSAAKSFATVATGAADAYAKVMIASAKTAKIESTIKPQLESLQQSLKGVENQSGRTAKATETLASVSKGLVAAYLAIKTALAALGGLDKINAAYDAQTAAVKRLNAALAIRGQQAASAAMQQTAKDLEKLTGVSDQATLALMQTAQSMGFATHKLDDAAKAATGLAAATGKTAEQSLGDMKAALEGNFEAFVGLNPQIMYMRTNQEKMAAVIAIANQGLAQQSKDMTSVSGSGRRADTAIGSLMESFGKIIAPIRVLINAGLQQLATALDKLLVPAVQYATSVLENIGPVMDYVKEKVTQAINIMIGAFTFFEVILTNLSSVWEIVKAASELAMITVSESVMHTLTKIIPAYAMWFGENFINLMKDAFNGVIAVITNAGRIIGEIVYQIFEFIVSGGQGGIEGLMTGLGQAASISLLDGFKSSLTSLPEIAERQLTAREKDLADKIGAVGGRLGQEFSDKMSERMLGVGSALGDEVNAATSRIDLKGRPAVMMQSIPATEGRLLTRGPGTRIPDIMQQILQELRKKPNEKPRILVRLDDDQNRLLQAVANNTQGKLQMEAIA